MASLMDYWDNSDSDLDSTGVDDSYQRHDNVISSDEYINEGDNWTYLCRSDRTINHVSPTGQESQRAQLAFFIDRGYLELAQIQGVKMSNLIQVMESMGVKFLGTIKESKSFPFQIVDLKESNAAVVNGRPVLQAYGDRSSYTARSSNKVASVLRHGSGKIRAARAATNLVECRQDTWAYAMDQSMSRILQVQRPPPFPKMRPLGKKLNKDGKNSSRRSYF